jgi:non-canonical purine NTP pyrophosphatase (RdgB/HAM1 family)
MTRPSTLILATTNQGKLREIRAVLEGLPFEVHALDEFAPIAEPEETGESFAENARAKARYYARATGGLVVAEDSGLEIDALDGAPGIYSARFGGAQAVTYPQKFDLIYRMFQERGVEGSTARYVCELALARPGEILFEARGVVEGEITRPPRGNEGFGYDPIFYYPPFGRTLAQVPADKKASVSHRGKAFRALREYLETVYLTGG